ncbi:acyl-CoA thioesterase [Leptospira gomenensis]|uniref:Acyl-CoA thioesterase n=1 Tax=Leptospira gomenensis TaxID=2484974 RepID=A0A5F1YAQ0_9LEPT|nr:thioesterase family protein [Leptospira gomenensis]TGK34476.1 acyl-CoA thioesterase [Leptospira gomenensis]TGK41862.1 acyl-CoA thioesterase [Leptospira gomenensis]TGK44799.1 acyl-CoA thioesterase [Leptospira gomenensis]TGK65186.1 acyl-CoA thioesterase [Leptospira gomenensis]
MGAVLKKEEFDFSYSFRVRYAECDAQGIVFNANYLTYFDVGITEYFRAHGLPYGESSEKLGLDFHVVHCSIDFKSPARFDDTVEVFVRGSFSGVKIFWDLAIYRENTALCSASLVYACVEIRGGGLKRVPRELAQNLGLNEG